MKLLSFFIFFMLFFVVEVKCQMEQASVDIEGSAVTGTYPSSSSMLRGGQEKTASGILKVLVVFVRYLDDTENTSTWPNYNVLPTWAQTFVDPSIPENNLFTPLNLTDFFDRSSGGDCNGNLGQFHVLGDVVYVTTQHNQSYYYYDALVFNEILQTLDNPNESYNINFKQYDNWKFMSGDTLFNHYYKPGVGDGLVDHIWFINRGASRDGVGAEKTLGGAYFTTNDGVTINNYSGSRIFNIKNITTPRSVGGPAHEYCHYLFGGSQTTGHFDGRTYNNYGNEGRINSFALMCASNNGYMSSYEEYRLGWLNPTIITSNTNSMVLNDSHISNQAIIIPLRYDVSTGWLKEYYFIENYETQNEYSGANPFLVESRFNHTLSHGLLVYHVKNEDFNIATNSSISIVNADGRYSWNLVQGSSTPYDRSDDLIGKDVPTYHSGYDYRDYITINIGGIVYNDYMALTESSFGGNPPPNHGRRYNSDDFLGTEKDFFNTGFNDVFTKFSNPAAYLGDDATSTNSGFQVLGFNSQTKQYTLSIQVDYNGVLSLVPSKPQNIKMAIASNHPQLSWDENLEPDLAGYNIYRQENSGNITQIAYVPKAERNLYTDTEALTNLPYDNISYTIKAKDTDGLLSVSSDAVSVMAIIPEPNLGDEDKIVKENYDFSLNQNYPNPFNPSTEIRYALKENAFVALKIFDVLGSEIAVLKNEYQPAGDYAVHFDASKLTSGTYFYSITAGSFSQTKKMILIK